MNGAIVLSLDQDATATHPLVDVLVEDRVDAVWVSLRSDSSNVSEAIQAIDDARCVVLCWTHGAISAEAEEFLTLGRLAARRSKAISCLLDAVVVPELGAATTVYDLRKWRRRPTGWRGWFNGFFFSWLGGNLYMRDYVTAVRFKVAGRDPPPPTAPAQMRRRRLLAAIPALFAIIAVIPTAFGFWVDLGMEDRPTAEESKAFAAVDQSDCTALRHFLAAHSKSALAAQAQAKLNGSTTSSKVFWEAMSRKMPLYAGDGLASPMANRQLALSYLDGRIDAEARRVCKGLAEAGKARLIGWKVLEGPQTCSPSAEGYRCKYDGDVECKLEEPREIEIESCKSTDMGK